MSRIALAAMAVTVFAAPMSGSAQDKRQLQKQWEESAAKLRAAGEPMDRCSLGGTVAVGPTVIRATGTSALKPGDKLLVLNGKPVAGKTPEEVIGILRQIAPATVMPTTVERNGHPVELSVACSNARQVTEPMLNALDFAARGKFDECVETISKMQYVDTATAAMKVQCATLSRNSGRYNMDELGAGVLEMAIEDATYVPGFRTQLVQQLHASEGQITRGLGAAKYQSMVDATKRWPGGETLYASAAPDWALFRRNAESELRGRLIDPDSAHIQWPYGFTMGTWKPFLAKAIEGYWTCGLINARNRMGGYTGATAFVVVLDPSGYVKYSEIGNGKDFDILTASCNKSAKMLPPAPAELLATPSSSSKGGVESLADEIKKLVDLKNSGALTEAEFQAAKAKLLNDAPR